MCVSAYFCIRCHISDSGTRPNTRICTSITKASWCKQMNRVSILGSSFKNLDSRIHASPNSRTHCPRIHAFHAPPSTALTWCLSLRFWHPSLPTGSSAKSLSCKCPHACQMHGYVLKIERFLFVSALSCPSSVVVYPCMTVSSCCMVLSDSFISSSMRSSCTMQGKTFRRLRTCTGLQSR